LAAECLLSGLPNTALDKPTGLGLQSAGRLPIADLLMQHAISGGTGPGLVFIDLGRTGAARQLGVVSKMVLPVLSRTIDSIPWCWHR